MDIAAVDHGMRIDHQVLAIHSSNAVSVLFHRTHLAADKECWRCVGSVGGGPDASTPLRSEAEEFESLRWQELEEKLISGMWP